MPQNESKTQPDVPWGDLFAEVRTADEKWDWVPIGIVYRPGPNNRATLVFEMFTEPMQWGDPHCPRKCMIIARAKDGRHA